MQEAHSFQESGSVGGDVLKWQISWSRCARANCLPLPPGQLGSACWERARAEV